MAIDLEQDTTFLGYRRENGRVGVRNHVIILPLDDLSNAAAEAVAQQHQGRAGDPASVRPAPVRRRPRPALPHPDRRRLQPERRRRGRHRHRGRLDQEGGRRHRRDRQARGRLRHRRPRRPRHHHARLEGGARVRAVGEREAARGLPDHRALGLDQVRRVRHHLRLRRPTRPWATPSTSCIRSAATSASARPPRSPAASRSSPSAAQRRGARAVHVHVRPLPGRDQSPQDQRPLRLAADQGQHRRRPDDDRGEGARQHPEDRQEVHGRRRHRQGRDADPSRPVVHGFVERGGRDGDAVRRVGLRGAFLPDRAGQRDRQPDPAGDQDLRQPAHRAR